MTNSINSVLTKEDQEEGQFVIICDYSDILSSKAIIVHADNEFFLYEVIPPFPSCDTYSKGEEFEEGNVISKHPTWADAKKAQNNRSNENRT